MIIGVALFANRDKDDTKKENNQVKNEEQQKEEVIEDEPVEEDQTEEEPLDDEPVIEEPSDAEYILPESNTRELTRAELESLTKEQLRLARNEMFARHGMIFGVEDLDSYFRTKSWYQPSVPAEDFYEKVEMSLIEEANVVLIQEVEDSK